MTGNELQSDSLGVSMIVSTMAIWEFTSRNPCWEEEKAEGFEGMTPLGQSLTLLQKSNGLSLTAVGSWSLGMAIVT